VRTSADWQKRRQEILRSWTKAMGPWPPLLSKPRLEILESKAREDFTQDHVKVEIASGQMVEGYLLVPQGPGPFPAVLIPYYEPETSVGLSKQELRDFGYQLARRGFVSLSVGSPGGDARKPDINGAHCQPMSFLGYVAANCHTLLAHMKNVDPARIGIIGHSYGGKWAMFGACLYDKFACGVWSDPGIVFDETRPNVNYWDPWYLGDQAGPARPSGLPNAARPRTGAYNALVEGGHDLTELQALMAPRPFLVSGGSEDTPSRWLALNRVNEVYNLLGAPQRVALTSRKDHTPTAESNAQIYAFFECFLKAGSGEGR
jgi:dienelactone hydrolase